jgi:hypothetical protein
MNLDNDPAFPAILNYNYNETIRPRGEVMIKTVFIIIIKVK